MELGRANPAPGTTRRKILAAPAHELRISMSAIMLFRLRLPMKNANFFPRLSIQQPSRAIIHRIAQAIEVAILLTATNIAVAQNPTPAASAPAPETKMTAPNGYAIHQTVDLGGRITNATGSPAMYDTLVNLQSGPRVLGETFEMHALPGKKNTLVDSLMAIGSGFGGDPNNFTRLNFSKGKIYEFSGMFRRDRQYFDYDLLGNPNIPGGQSIPIGPGRRSSNPRSFTTPCAA